MSTTLYLRVQRREPDGERWMDVIVPQEREDRLQFQNIYAQLGGVRNGQGFAGVRTGEPFVPVAADRGDVKGCSLRGAEYGYSWTLLSELLSYDLDRTTERCGVIERRQFESWDRKRWLGAYCGWIEGPHILVVEDAWIDRQGIVDAPDVQVLASYTHVLIHWRETYRESGGALWSEFVPWLQTLGAPDDVRIVFGFAS